jgi:hypothetical protein
MRGDLAMSAVYPSRADLLDHFGFSWIPSAADCAPKQNARKVRRGSGQRRSRTGDIYMLIRNYLAIARPGF